MNGIANSLRILDAQWEASRKPKTNAAVNANGPASFKDVLGNTIDQQIQFSKHANTRLNDRNITLTGEQMERVESGIEKANAKGIRDSLVLVDNVALVVNVKSRTVITAMNQDNDHIFSNIDGAVIV